MMGSQERPKREKPSQLKEQKVKSLRFFKPTLATTLAIVLAWLLSVRPAQAGYIVTLQQVGPDVVATGSGRIDLTGLTKAPFTGLYFHPEITPADAVMRTGPTFTGGVTLYGGASGPTSFGSGGTTLASNGSGNMVGISNGALSVPNGYVSGTALSDNATY